MTIEHSGEDDVTHLAKRVEHARGRLAYQFDPALTEALSEDELRAERELAEKIREAERDQRWKHVQAAAAASDEARTTSQKIAKADMRDLLLARRALAAQRRESSPHAKLASLYRHRAWSLRALAGVVAAGMLWSAVNVQHNIAPGGPTDPLYWFSYLLEAMISVCLVIIMIGTNKVAEWGILDSRKQVAIAELALLSLTVGLNTYPYLRGGRWYDVGVHAVAPVMIGVALLIHHAASSRYGLAIAHATEQVRDLPDPSEQIRRTMPTFVSFFRQNVSPDVTRPSGALMALPGGEATTAEGPTRVDNTESDKPSTVDADDPLTSFRSAGADDSVTTEYRANDAWLNGSDVNGSAKNGKPSANGKSASNSADPDAAQDDPLNGYDTGQFRIAETLEQELAELRAERRRARASKQRASSFSED
ncbi:hypothetical protein [Nocardia macrotermitis]|uniref:Uncharacterized protein n=1 Tax=Nocardia macrotermitis TaxID=2585198 RepID=A0A7K0DAM1_9NOCA|nr:hypothetical protein [Nocardia macrotermitis]MQY22767.1 hypothetical protein [Nocardia macrotermitis]